MIPQWWSYRWLACTKACRSISFGMLLLSLAIELCCGGKLLAQDEKASIYQAPVDRLILVVGASGTDEFEAEFAEWSAAWRELAEANGWQLLTIGAGAESPSNSHAASVAQPTADSTNSETGQIASPPSDATASDANTNDANTNDANVNDANANYAEAAPSADTATTQPDQAAQPTQAANQVDQEAREQLQQALESLDYFTGTAWLVFIGHGTYTNGIAKFNLPGPDVTPEEVSGWADGFSGKLVAIDCASASAPFMQAMSKPGRVVVTATQSGSEFNYARFGKFLAKSILNESSDLDHDDSVSLLEAFLSASQQTDEFYAEAARLATEHAILDDNHDRIGTPRGFFRGVKPVKTPQGNGQVDGKVAAKTILFVSPRAIALSAAQAAERDELEAAIEELKGRKETLATDAYYDQLEDLVLKISAIYADAESNARP